MAADRLDGAVILLYHRVVDLPVDPFCMAIAPEDFDEHLRIIKADYEPLGLSELADAVREGRVPRGGVVVTFDDGYADNLEIAKPMLESHGVPATVFVATGYVGAAREFWWDELERLLPEVSREGQLMELQWKLRHSTAEQIDTALEQLRERTWEGVRASHRPLTVEQLRSLTSGALIEVGAHSRHHANLAGSTPESQREELEGSRSDLEGWLGQPVRGLSFPFGRRNRDYSSRTVRIARAAGFEYAVARGTTRVTTISNVMEMPRVVAPAVPGKDFERWLRLRFR